MHRVGFLKCTRQVLGNPHSRLASPALPGYSPGQMILLESMPDESFCPCGQFPRHVLFSSFSHTSL